MIVKLVLTVLVAINGCNAYDVNDESQNCYNVAKDVTCTDSNKTKIKIFAYGKRLSITCATPILIDFKSFKHKINVEVHDVDIINCSISRGFSFSALLERYGIKNELLSFQANNVGSLTGRFSSQFEKLENLILSRNQITEVNEHTLPLLLSLSKLDLSGNRISYLHKNAFSKLLQLKELKLNVNKLVSLPDGIFGYQKKLEILYLNRNYLVNITKETFEGLDSLIVLNLEWNYFKQISDDVFHNIPKLRQIQLGHKNIKIPYNVFAEHYNLKYVHLQKVNITNGLNVRNLEELKIRSCEVMTISGLSNVKDVKIYESTIHSLPEKSFQNQSDMISLDLSSNKLCSLSDRLFHGLKNLVRLQLEHNRLTNISGVIFRDLQNLTTIDLSHNWLATIHPHAFDNATRLKYVNLTHNKLTQLPSNLIKLEKLQELNLDSNEVSSLKYNELRSTNIRLNSTYEIKLAPATSLHINLNNNRLKCDCTMYEFLLDKSELSNAFRHSCLHDEHSLRICDRDIFSSDWKCPIGCRCFERKSRTEREIIISCDGKGLTTVPEIVIDDAISFELDIRNNELTELPKLHQNAQISAIRASNNKITRIELDNLPPNLRALDVTQNNIQTISANVLDHLKNHKNLQIILLNANPFLCKCTNESEQLIAFAKEYNSLTDLEDVICKVSNSSQTFLGGFLKSHCLTKSLQSANEAKNNYASLTLVLIVLSVLSTLGGIVGILCYKYKQLIKVWLYAHNACIWWVDKEYLDRNKEFDAFISYSELDMDYAYKLVTKLESGENGSRRFSLCVHKRNFIPGQLISQSIVESVKKSRRTIIILSANFIKSGWAMHEFHYAFSKSVAEKRNRLIIVKYGGIDTDELDDTIKSYIKTRTYIEWNDPWFWQKIVYALTN